MQLLLRRSTILFVFFLLTGCNSLTVRVSAYEPPPIPAELLVPCPEPLPLQPDAPEGGLTFKGVFLAYLADSGPAAECRGQLKQLAVVVQYREKVRQDIRNLSQSSKSWWEFWK